MTRLFCFHTGSRYGLLARKCAKSFASFGVRITLVHLNSKKNWMKNCMSRCVELSRLAEKYPEDSIGLLDSDLICMQYPELLVNFTGDIAVHDLTDTQPGKVQPCFRYSAGVSVFGPTVKGRACLKRWAELCIEDKLKGEMLREQVYLYQAIHEGQYDQWGDLKKKDFLIVTNIGEKYNRTIDQFNEGDDTVILHKVASRKLREQIGGHM